MDTARQADERFMAEAIAEAALTDPAEAAPNPRVGAVIVEGGHVVARGRFEKDGGPHAERQALEALGRSPGVDAVMYVTLEPCSTHGRTGACTDALIAAGIQRVVVGAMDPTKEHRGRGLGVLASVGVDVQHSILEAECEALNPGFSGHSSVSR